MISKRKIHIFETPQEANDFVFSRWKEAAEHAIATRGRFTAALSGGRTPISFYHKLSEYDDFNIWLKTHVFLTDERFVPHSAEASNYGMIRRHLVPLQTAPEANYHPIPTDVENISISAEMYKDALMRFFDYQRTGVPVFDFCLLGVGEDGHTASLFPGMAGLDDPGRWTIPVSENHLKEERVSLTLTVLNHARLSMALILGSSKALIVRAMLEEGFVCPAAQLQPREGELVFVMDRAAASQLKQTGDLHIL